MEQQKQKIKLIEILKRFGTSKAEYTAAKLQQYAGKVLYAPVEYVETLQLSLAQHVNHIRCSISICIACGRYSDGDSRLVTNCALTYFVDNGYICAGSCCVRRVVHFSCYRVKGYGACCCPSNLCEGVAIVG